MAKKEAVYYVRFVCSNECINKNGILRKNIILKKSGFLCGNNKIKKSGFAVVKEKCSGIDGLRVILLVAKRELISEKSMTLLKKELSRYDTSEAVLLADDVMAEAVGLDKELFKARKNEFINNVSFIIEMLKKRMPTDDRMVVVIESMGWSNADIYKILTAVKNHYRNIDIIVSDKCDMTSVVSTAYDEWGLMIDVSSINNHQQRKWDMGLFLVNSKDGFIDFWRRKICCGISYVVADKKMSSDMCDGKERNGRKSDYLPHNAFCGLKYKAESAMPYELAVNMAYQKPVLYEKFHVSFIDICRL